MKIVICGNKKEANLLKKLTTAYCAEGNCYPIVDTFYSKEAVIIASVKEKYSIAIVAIENTKAMETIKHIHRLDKEVKIIWFSEDENFAGCAFENGVKQFALKPISKEKLHDGLEGCGISIREDNICRVHLKAD